MPATTSSRSAFGSNSAGTSRQDLEEEQMNFEDLALHTLQALNPTRKLNKSDIRIKRVKKLIGKLLHNQIPIKPNFEPSTSSNKANINSCRTQLPKIEEGVICEKDVIEKRREVLKLKRRISNGEESETEPMEEIHLSQLEVLIDQALEEKSSHESFGVLSRELHSLFKTSTSNKKLLDFLENQPLRSVIDSRRSPDKNIQCIEVQILVELYKIKLRRDLSNNRNKKEAQSGVLAKLRFLNIITGGTHLANFMAQTMDSEFAISLPVELKQLHERICVEMNDEYKFFNQANSDISLSLDTPSSLNSTPSQSSSSAISIFHEDGNDEVYPTLENMTNLESPPISPDRANEESKSPFSRRKISYSSLSNDADSRHSISKVSTRRSTINTEDDLPPKLSSLESTPPHFQLKEESVEYEPPLLTNMVTRKSSRTAITKEKNCSRKTSLRVNSKGSIASRRQTNKRLCVIRQNVKDLILPTSRRRSTASLQTTQQPSQRRSSYFERFERIAQKAQFEQQSNRPALPTKRNQDSSVSVKTKNKVSVITPVIIARYRNRMKVLKQASNKIHENEVFYGRCNLRTDLFEMEKNDNSIEDQKPSKSKPTQVARKQKNRSGHLVKQQADSDCLYVSHTLLNVHHKDPLSSIRPKPGNGKLAWASKNRRANNKLDNPPFRIKRLVRHANRAKFLKIRQYIQRSQQQELQKRIKQEEQTNPPFSPSHF